jgi:hypothetical protein
MLCIFILYISILTHAPPSPPFLTFGARHSHGCGRLYACSPPGGTQCPPFTVLVLVINTHYYYFRRKPDITRIPPYGAFTCIYKECRDLKDQGFGLTSIQGAFICIAHHRKTLGYCITDGTRVSCTRHHIAFDPYLYPFKLNATAPPAWQTFHNLTTAKPQAAIKDFTAPQTTTDLPHTAELPDNSDESDFDPEIPAPANTSVEIDDMQPALIDSDSDEEHMVPAVPEPPMPTGRSTRVRQAPVSFKAPARQTTYQRYNNDGSFRTTRDALVNTKVRKCFPGHGTFQGIITSYYPITDNYHILYDDGDEEVDTYASIQKYIESTPERESCLLVLNLVSSTLPCIRRPRPRLRVLDVCGFV